MSFAAGAAATAAGKTVSCGSGTTTVTCLVFGINQTVIPNGVVATVTVNISPSTLSTSTPLTLSQGAASSVSGGSIPTTTVGSTIAIAQPPRPSSVSCNPSTVTTPGSSNCTVTLNQTAGAGGTAVALSSNNANLTVPASVTVAAGFISANFTANAAQVSSIQSATITASANGGVAQTSPALTLNPPANQPITVTTNPAGLQIIVDGATYTSPQTFQWVPGSSHSIGVTSPQTATGIRRTFTSWSDGGAQTHNITTPSTATTYTANFQTSYLLTTGVSPSGSGSVQVSPASGDGYYLSGTSLTLTPVPASGYRFSNWTGSPGSSTASPLVFSIAAPQSITGNFVVDAPGTQPITVTTNPAGLQILVDGTTYTSPQTFQWVPGSSHSIGVNSPQTSTGTRHTFTSWSDGGAQTHNITTPSTATTYTANFLTSYLLTTAVSPAGSGTIQVSPPSGDGHYAAGTTVQLTPVPAAGFQFNNWSGDLGNSGTTPLVFSMTAPRFVTGNFSPVTSSCTPTLSKNTFAISPDGDLLRVDVTAGQGCHWNTVNSESWITILEGFSGSGAGRVRFTVAPNPASQVRTGIITIGGVAVAIHQANSGCTGPFSVTPPTMQFGGGGGELGSAVSSLSTCVWPIATAPGWLTVREGTGAGSGTGIKTLQAPANTAGVPRTGSYTVAGMTVTVLQEAIGPTTTFSDIPSSHPQANYIALLRLNNVTSGCSATEYCPDAATTRGQMAAFIIRSLMKGDVFPYPPTPYFSDVPPSHPFFPHIQKMRELGITNGCSPSEYCPDAFVTRGQMAVFLVRARLGISTEAGLPYPGAAYFSDVAPSHPFYVYIQKLRQLGITVGCTVSEYCPEAPTTRAQMAAFLIRAFFTP